MTSLANISQKVKMEVLRVETKCKRRKERMNIISKQKLNISFYLQSVCLCCCCSVCFSTKSFVRQRVNSRQRKKNEKTQLRIIKTFVSFRALLRNCTTLIYKQQNFQKSLKKKIEHHQSAVSSFSHFLDKKKNSKLNL